jgi:multidrug efflux pump subunit AcrA (membrane-fusion protein)
MIMSKTTDQPENVNSDTTTTVPDRPVESKGTTRHRLDFKRRKLIVGSLIVLVFFSSLLTLGITAHVKRLRKIDNASNAVKQAVPVVQVITAQQSHANSDLVLPGNIEAIQVTTINARTSGYLKQWYVDLGDRVRVGQKLADIDTPEVDQALQQAQSDLLQARAMLAQSQANLEQARTNMAFARVSFARYQNLVELGVVTHQDTDQREAEYNSAKATVNAMQASVRVSESSIHSNEANVRRLTDLQGFKRVYAPFAGIITARNVEIGSLIGTSGTNSTGTTSAGASSSSTTSASTSAGGGGATTGGIFSLARTDTVRIHVSVPQTYVSAVKVGMTADVSIRELPQKTFTGRVVRRAEALDPASRTMLVEVDLSNRDFSLLPGMYAEVKFRVNLSDPPVRVPANVLIIRTSGPQVLVVTADQKVHYQNVELGTDYGAEIDINQGLEPGSTVVTNPGATLSEGQSVTVMTARTPQAR